MDINYQRSPKTEQYITAKISGNALKQGSSSATAAQFTTAKIQGCANALLNGSRSEGMRLGWQTPRVDSLKLANSTRIGNAHKVHKKIFVFLCGCYMCSY